MKRFRQLFFISSLAVLYQLCFYNSSAQSISINSIHDTIAFVDAAYTCNVFATTNLENQPVTFSLLKSLPGMTISNVPPLNATISWTPGSVAAGGKVVVKAINTAMEADTQEFFINVSNAIPCPESMVAYWKLDENNGPVYADYYGDNNAHVAVNTPVSVTGQIDKAQEFDLLNNRGLYVPDDTLFDWGSEEDFSIECWISLSDDIFDSVGVIIGRNEGTTDYTTGVHWWIGVDDNKIANFAVRDNVGEPTCTGESSLSPGWHHIVAVRDAANNQILLYQDGLLQNDAVDYYGWPPGFSTDSLLCIGWLQPGPGDQGKRYPFNGKIDELIIHNKALTSQEVSNSYSHGNLGKPACRTGNFAPLFRTDPLTEINEDLPYSYKYLAVDIDGDPLTYNIVTKPAWLTHSPGSKTLSGIPSNDDVGTFAVKIMVTDSKDTIYQNFSITVSNVNDPPQLSAIGGSTLSFTEGDSPLVITSTVIAEDVDDTILESALVSITSDYHNGEDILAFTNTASISGAWNSSAGELTLTGNDTKAGYQSALRSITYQNVSEDPSSSVRTVSFKVYDGEAYSNIAARNISIVPVNDLPVITGHPSISTPEDDTILIRFQHLTFSDVDNDIAEMTLTVMDGDHYTHDGNIVTPDTNFNDTLRVNVRLSDQAASVDYVLPVYVTPVNDLPNFTFTAPPQAFEGQFYFFTLEAQDPDAGDVLTFSAPKLPSWLQLNGNLLTGKPGFQHVGENTVTVRVTDSKANVDSTFTILVNQTNHKPAITSTPVTTVNEDADYVYNVAYTDADAGDILILYTDSIPDWLTYDSNLKRLSGKPTNDQVGFKSDSAYYVKLRISDTKQDSVQSFYITVKNINDAPVITGQLTTPVVNPDSSFIITMDDLIAADVDNPVSDLNLTIFAGTGYSITGDIITINSGVTGQISVKVVVDDGTLESNEYNYRVDVKPLTGIDETAGQNNPAVKVYPNPAEEVIHFDFSLSDNGWIDIYSNDGRLIFKQPLTRDTKSFELNTGSFAPGTYYFKIYSNSEVYRGKFMTR